MDQASLDTPTKENTHKYEHYRVNELKLKKLQLLSVHLIAN